MNNDETLGVRLLRTADGKLPARRCIRCGGTYVPDLPDQRHCAECATQLIPKSEKQCVECKKTYLPLYGNQRYCTNDCRVRAESKRYHQFLNERKRKRRRRRRATDVQRLCDMGRRIIDRTGGPEVRSTTVHDGDITVTVERGLDT